MFGPGPARSRGRTLFSIGGHRPAPRNRPVHSFRSDDASRSTSMARLFGTDGVRGLANGDLTADLALRLSVAAAHVLRHGSDGTGVRGSGTRPFAVVGRDPRASGEFLEAAVVAGIASAGVDVVRVGVLP